MKIANINIGKFTYKHFFTNLVNLGGIVFTPNPEIVLQAKTDREFEYILNQANYLVPDGLGLYFAYQVLDNPYGKLLNLFFSPYYIFRLLFQKQDLYQKYGERICGSDLTKDLLNHANNIGLKVVIVDPYHPEDIAKVESQKEFLSKIQWLYPSVKFLFLIDKNRTDTLQKVQDFQPDYVFATLGMKRQEACILEIKKAFPNLKIGAGVGSSFDYLIGFQKRAPKWISAIGFEWLYRIFTGPKKLKRLKRIYKALIVFPIMVISTK